MANLNRVFLAGNLTRDPEVRYTPSGKAVSDLGMAINRKYKTNDGEDKEETCYVRVVVWGRQAETCGEYLRKGSPLLVEGRLQYDAWEKDGQKFNSLRVVASRVQFLGSPRGAQGHGDREDRTDYNKDSVSEGPGPANDPGSEEQPGPANDPGSEEQPGPASNAGSEEPKPANNGGDDDNLPF